MADGGSRDQGGEGAGVGFISTVPAFGGGDSSPAGAGDGVKSVEPEGAEAGLVWLVYEELPLLLANTTTASFSFLRQLSLFPLMK
ncbi:hypothetical protein O6P43_000843 [Quillaja saponaria]|uniref:Uncharacterized protein n=1 Tax=Quillaja saponaria TaxID=32244 RepID=A0AAD7QIV3_QUISA|nr:hypothetical protein O6P43_000843 [Quillaja saponaria]